MELKNQPLSNRWNFRFLTRFHVLTLIYPHQDPTILFNTWINKYNNHISFWTPLLHLLALTSKSREQQRAMEQIHLIKTQNLGIIKGSILELYSIVPSNMCLYLTYWLRTQSRINGSIILRFCVFTKRICSMTRARICIENRKTWDSMLHDGCKTVDQDLGHLVKQMNEIATILL